MLAILALFACSPTPAPGAFVVVTDTMRADLGGAPTKGWDECRVYTRAHSAAPYTSSSVYTLLTGENPVGLGRLGPIAARATWPGSLSPELDDARARRVDDWRERTASTTWPDRVISEQDYPHLLTGGDPDDALWWDETWEPAREAIGKPGHTYVHAFAVHGPYEGAGHPTQVTGALFAQADAGQVDAEHAAWARLQYRARAEQYADRVWNLGYAARGAGHLFIWTADHGEALGEGGLWGHGKSLHDPQIHVPLVVCGPGVVPGEDSTPVGPLCVAETVTGSGPCDLRTGEGLRAGEAGRLVDGEWVTRDVGGEWAAVADGGSAG